MKRFSVLLTISILFAFAACTKKEAEPRAIIYDRDVCARCVMQLSDPRFVAQAVNKQTGENAVFEEMGCGVMWLEDHGWDNYTFYVADLKTGKWVKFDEAYFAIEYITPMAYGIVGMADKESLEEGKTLITKDEAYNRIKTMNAERQQNKMNMQQGGDK